jgi:PncC family amidohydrolase
MMQELMPLAERVAERLKARGETVAVAESSTGGLVSAALVAVPGASAFYLGGAVVYTHESRRGLMQVPDDVFKEGMRASTEPYALLMARAARELMGAVWGVAETGATGPDGNRYGDAAGHSCLAVVGPVERALTIETGHGNRAANMVEFSRMALALLAEELG